MFDHQTAMFTMFDGDFLKSCFIGEIINGGIHTTIFIRHVFAFILKLHHVSPCLIVKTATSNPWPDGHVTVADVRASRWWDAWGYSQAKHQDRGNPEAWTDEDNMSKHIFIRLVIVLHEGNMCICWLKK